MTLTNVVQELDKGFLSLTCHISYLTIPLETVERFPISFHSYFLHRTYRHVVLGVYHSGKYGALGMSRRKNLMYKELKYRV